MPRRVLRVRHRVRSAAVTEWTRADDAPRASSLRLVKSRDSCCRIFTARAHPARAELADPAGDWWCTDFLSLRPVLVPRQNVVPATRTRAELRAALPRRTAATSPA